jgi:hypothetical protein
MFLALWEFEVKPGYEERCEKVYAPTVTGPGSFEPTPIIKRLVSYSTLSSLGISHPWTSPDSQESYEEFMATHAIEYKAMEAAGRNYRSTNDESGGAGLRHPDAKATETPALPGFPSHMATKPSAPRSDWRIILGVPATRSTASAAR